MNKYRIAVVSPVHIQPSEEWVEAVDALGVDIIVVDDSNGKVKLPERWDVYGYDRQKAYLGSKYEYWQKFQHSSACKNFGHWVAYNLGYDIIVGIDSDCIPQDGFIEQHIANLEKTSYLWENVLANTKWFSRGFPYSAREAKTALSLGLWKGELDLYGKDRVDYPERQTAQPHEEGQKVAQNYIPLSGMNWATWRENIPDLLFLPNHDMGEIYVEDKLVDSGKFRRHDDIWGGYIFQKKMQERGQRIVYGAPIVIHDTIVDAEADAEEEKAMIMHEDAFFDSIDAGKPWPWVREALTFWKSLYE